MVTPRSARAALCCSSRLRGARHAQPRSAALRHFVQEASLESGGFACHRGGWWLKNVPVEEAWTHYLAPSCVDSDARIKLCALSASAP
eukprot:4640239-Alexandrium_andersonii.AAC.1